MSAAFPLNPEQEQAVKHTEGPVLILAGAGSGKTRVLTERVAYLIKECDVRPWQILAITFTNKAAKELRERVALSVGDDAKGVLAATFHATCVRILRRHADLLGYDTHFSIYDSDDSKSLMKQIVKRYQLETRDLKLRKILHTISAAKDTLTSPEEFLLSGPSTGSGSAWRSSGSGTMTVAEPVEAPGSLYARNHERIARAYREYQRALLESNAFDFDDLIMKTVELFRLHSEVLEEYQERWKYICVDEYQDTNNAQFELVRLLAGRHRNLCVVGDDDQSIYRFRGANIRNILDFEQVYPDAFTVKLEQNYRSTTHILNAANGVISHNAGRKDKALWSDLGDGDPVRLRTFNTAYDEADFVSQEIASLKKQKKTRYEDIAVLYRTNAQSRLIEERFVREGIPYELVGGVNFYARREIKDILAYLKTIDNARDDLAVQRIINVPKRGIGQTTVDKIADYAALHEISFYEALSHANEILSGAAAKKTDAFLDFMEEMRALSTESSVSDLIREMISKTDYEDYLYSISEDQPLFDDEENERVLNVQELISKAEDYDDAAEESSLSGFLEEVALVADIDMTDDSYDRALLMTLHAAKGLEFERVYLTGMEEDVFPSYQACQAEEYDRQAMEEERRLAYVGFTRAKRFLTLTAARMRTARGETHYHQISRFVTEIPRTELDADETSEEVYESAKDIAPARKEMSAVKDNALQYLRSFQKTATPVMQKGIPVGEKPDYDTGDRVRHIKFGEGTVQSLEKEPRDYKVSVLFDDYGVKVMYAAFAKLVKL